MGAVNHSDLLVPQTTIHVSVSDVITVGQNKMKFERVLSAGIQPDQTVQDLVKWKVVDARVTDGEKIIFEQLGVRVPEQWSEQAINILAQKYFRKAGVPSVTITSLPRDVSDTNIPSWLRSQHPAI